MVEKVIVALSGGIDSSVAAHILKSDGYEVVGVHLNLWCAPAEWNGGSPEGAGGAESARQVAEHLGIEFHAIEARDFFRSTIVEPFVREYLRGRTPNPCVVCNNAVKLALLLEKAREIGAEYVATGHYAIIELDPDLERQVIRRGTDNTKDQSYYLARITRDKLPHFKTPLGRLTKNKVRDIALELDLPSRHQPESQEVCFIPSDDYRGFVTRYARECLDEEEPKPGLIYDTKGNEIGRHKGIPFYTIGQRKGLGIAAPEPLYVIEIDVARNALVAGTKDEALFSGLTGTQPNWLATDPPEEPMDVAVQIRYRHTPVQARLTVKNNGTIEIHFATPQPGVTPGQLAVFYNNDTVLGSAFIKGPLEK
jgi:tRNA-specific 2-thiouridylase